MVELKAFISDSKALEYILCEIIFNVSAHTSYGRLSFLVVGHRPYLTYVFQPQAQTAIIMPRVASYQNTIFWRAQVCVEVVSYLFIC